MKNIILEAPITLELDIEEVVKCFLKERKKDPSLTPSQFMKNYWSGLDDIYYYNGDLEIQFKKAFYETLDGIVQNKKQNDDEIVDKLTDNMLSTFNQAIAEELDGEPYHETYVRLFKQVIEKLQDKVKELDGNE